MIEVEHLSKHYGDRRAVDDVTFVARRGEVVGFLGPNGAGKTTTLRMLTGFLSPTSGKVRLDGVDVLGSPLEARRRIGYMPEGVPLYPEMRVVEYLRFRAALKGVPSRGRAAAIDRVLEEADLRDARSRILGQLSKGYRQRVGLADALLADPPILILDEPTAGLDPNQIRHVRDVVRGFSGAKTVLLSTHILPEVEATCGRVIIIHHGRLAGEGAPSTLRGRTGGSILRAVARAPGLAGDAASARVTQVLGGASGVAAVLDAAHEGGDLVRARLRVDAAPDVAERVFEAAARSGLVLRELGPETQRLEEVFAELTTADAAAEPAAGRGEAAP